MKNSTLRRPTVAATVAVAAASLVATLPAASVRAQQSEQTPQNEQAAPQPPSRVATAPNVVPGGTRTEIALGGRVILRMRDAGGFTAEERAAIVRQRLIPILSMPDLQPSAVTVRPGPAGAWATIYVRDHMLVTVTEALARANNTTPVRLARIYADRFRRVLPRVNVTDRDPQTGAPMSGMDRGGTAKATAPGTRP